MRCVEALRGERVGLANVRAIVVDGGSGDQSESILSEFAGRPDFHDWVSFLPLAVNGGFGWANNQAMLRLSREVPPPEFVYLLNPDTEVERGAVGALVAELRDNPRSGAAGSRLLTPDGRIAASAFRFPSWGREFIGAAQSEILGRMLGIGSVVVESEQSVEVDWVTGASVMFRVDALRQTGLFDDGFFLYFEEVELMHRLHKKGWTVRHVPGSRVIHIEGASTGIGAATAQRPHPEYWYDSRRRYYALTGSRSALLRANLALLGGKGVAALKRLVGRKPAPAACRTENILKRFRSDESDRKPSFPAWGDPPGRLPAWMERA